jgi:hypothetical protein
MTFHEDGTGHKANNNNNNNNNMFVHVTGGERLNEE